MTEREVARLARQLMDKHGLEDWTYVPSRAKRQYGSTNRDRTLIRISVVLAALNPEAQTRDTILHEIAHALTTCKGHGPEWRRIARAIGARPARCYGSEVVQPPRPPAKYLKVCPSCGVIGGTSRRSSRSTSCARCSGGAYNPQFKITYRLNRR